MEINEWKTLIFCGREVRKTPNASYGGWLCRSLRHGCAACNFAGERRPHWLGRAMAGCAEIECDNIE